MPIATSVHAPVAQGACDACHAPDTGGHVYPLVRAGEELCGACHQTGNRMAFRHKAMSDNGCLACHNAHSSKARSLLVADSVQHTCEKCHVSSEGQHSHKPYVEGKCDSCHEPHGSDSPLLLRGGDVEGNCGICHAPTVNAMASSAHSHKSAKGSCLACHSAHVSEWKGLQRAEPRANCTVCHEETGKVVANAIVSHDAVLNGDQCGSCHEPHASSNAMMLRSDQAPACLRCHSKPVTATDGHKVPEMKDVLASKKFVHGPVAAGDCGACHSVHGGKHSKLLKELNPSILTGAFDIRNYALCFSCHDQNLAISESGQSTQFRNGDSNLHRKHLLGGDRSRSCATCHAVHSSDRPGLIAESIPYDGSDWKMPMGFFKTPDGGGCSPGCHEPLRYSRSLRKDADQKEKGAP